jgi:peptidoglycan L-alanyl-D-glutamate endopeptidase CwlK
MKMTLEDMIKSIQDKLNIVVDGRAGPQTWDAIYRKIVNPVIPAAPTHLDQVDAQSEKISATLLPEVQNYARALVHRAGSNGILIRVISGMRSYAEQDALYARGRTVQPGPIVTNAPGGYSNHNFGIAFDIGVFEGDRYLGESPKYRAVGILGKELGLEWGGSWTEFVDQPHFQLRPAWAENLSGAEMLASLRDRAENQTPVYA